MGDYNARTGTLDDFISLDEQICVQCGLESDNELFRTKSKLEDLGVCTTRFNMDAHTNNNGLNLIEFCRNTDLKLVNGRFGNDRGVGQLSCISGNGSTIDYVIASPAILCSISNFDIELLDPCLSDVHSATSLTFDVNTSDPSGNCRAFGYSSVAPADETVLNDVPSTLHSK